MVATSPGHRRRPVDPPPSRVALDHNSRTGRRRWRGRWRRPSGRAPSRPRRSSLRRPAPEEDEQVDGLEPGRDGDGEGDPGQPERVDEDDRKGRVDDNRPDRRERPASACPVARRRPGPARRSGHGRRGRRGTRGTSTRSAGPPRVEVGEEERDDSHGRIAVRAATGIITTTMARIAPPGAPKTTSRSPGRPPGEATGTGRRPSGTPMTPIGIWTRVEAMVKAVTAPTPGVVASAVTTTNLVWDAPRPIARGAMRPGRVRADRVGRCR